jgi:hypothetical protein
MDVSIIIDILTKVVPAIVAIVAIPLTVIQILNNKRNYNIDKYEKLKEIVKQAGDNEALALFGFQSLLGKKMTIQELRIFTKENYPIIDLLHSSDDRKAVKFDENGNVIDKSLFKTKKTKTISFIVGWIIFTCSFIFGFSIIGFFIGLGEELREKWYLSLILALPTYYTLTMICITTFQFSVRKVIQIKYLKLRN